MAEENEIAQEGPAEDAGPSAEELRVGWRSLQARITARRRGNHVTRSARWLDIRERPR